MFGLSKRKLACLWLLLAVGLALRLWLIFTQHDRLITPYDDKMYLQSAQRLLEAGMFTFGSHLDRPTVFIPPLFPLYLTGMFAAFGTGEVGMHAARIGVALMGAGVMVLTVALGARLKHPVAGLVAAGVMAVYPPLVLLNAAYLTETMFTMWSLLFFLWLLKAIESGDRRHLLLAGLFLGLGTLTRPTFALFPAVVGVYLWARQDYGFKKAFVAGAVLVATLVVVLSPWMIRNYVQFDRFIPLTKASGNPFLTGTYVNHDVWANGADPEFPDYPLGWKKVPGDLLATDALLMELGKKRLSAAFKRDPWGVIKWYTYGKFTRYWGGPFDWADLTLPWKKALTVLHLVLMGLALLGLVTAIRRRVPYTWLLVMWLGYFTALHMVYVTSPRYATPLLPIAFLYLGMLFTTTPLWKKS